MISRRLRDAVKLSELRAYEIAHRANLHPSTLSRILNGIENVMPGDPRVLRIAKVLNLSPAECFAEEGERCPKNFGGKASKQWRKGV